MGPGCAGSKSPTEHHRAQGHHGAESWCPLATVPPPAARAARPGPRILAVGAHRALPGTRELPAAPRGTPGGRSWGSGAGRGDRSQPRLHGLDFRHLLKGKKPPSQTGFFQHHPGQIGLGWLWEPPMQAQGFQEGEAPFLAGLHPRSQGTAPFRAEPSTPGCLEPSVPHFGSPCPQPAGWELPRPWHAKDGETGTWPPAPGAQSLPRAAAAALHPGCTLKFKTDPA